ncbi:hypothetical protein H8356DRAFT_1293004 [Neocallimastix lanati (nom. inval.)]|nr:hypothetical protein H8356DRAFT_1293004 [Neocallimastix sp. JGI-2020a]
MKIFIFFLFVLYINFYKIGKCEIINENNKNLCFLNNTNFYYSESISFTKNNPFFLNTQKECVNQIDKEFVFEERQNNLELIHHKYFQNPLKTIKIDKKKNNESIIISMSSNRKKIDTIYKSVENLLNQTLNATYIILTLSVDDFPKKDEELPNSLIELTKTFLNFKIKWIKNNINDYKRITVVDDYPEDVIIIVNEEIKYPKWFINEIYSEYVQYGRQCAIKYTISKENDYSIDIDALLLKKEFMGKYYEEFIKEIIGLYPENQYIAYLSYVFAIYLNGYRIRKNHKLEMLSFNYFNNTNNLKLNNDFSNKLYKFNECFEVLKNDIYKRYKISYFEMLDAPIVVTMTTYPAREESVVIMLEHFKKQTLKPDLITVWLSETEYPKNITPSHLKPFVDEGFIELHWTPLNTYGSKRFEVMKLYNNAFVISVDDDFYYPELYIETLYINMILTNKICIYNSDYNYFKGYKLEKKNSGKNDSLYVNVFAGLIGFPPFTFPIQIFDKKYLNIRNKYYLTNEEIWIFSGLLENEEKIHSIDGINFNFNFIENSQNIALYKINLKHHVLEYMTSRMVIELNLVEKFKKLHPEFNVYRNIKYHKLLNKIRYKKKLKLKIKNLTKINQ